MHNTKLCGGLFKDVNEGNMIHNSQYINLLLRCEGLKGCEYCPADGLKIFFAACGCIWVYAVSGPGGDGAVPKSLMDVVHGSVIGGSKIPQVMVELVGCCSKLISWHGNVALTIDNGAHDNTPNMILRDEYICNLDQFCSYIEWRGACGDIIAAQI